MDTTHNTSQVEMEAKGASRHPVLVPQPSVVAEQALPEKRVDVQIQHQTVAVELQCLGGDGPERRSPSTACGDQASRCREGLPEEVAAR